MVETPEFLEVDDVFMMGKGDPHLASNVLLREVLAVQNEEEFFLVQMSEGQETDAMEIIL